VEVCAVDGDPEDPNETVHVWKNLLPQQRPQIKSFTIPSTIDGITNYSLMTGFEFQIRLVWTGRVTIYKTVLHASPLDDPAWAMRDMLTDSCLENDVTGNEIEYSITANACPFILITRNPTDTTALTDDEDQPSVDSVTFVQYDGDFVYPNCMHTYGNVYYKRETAIGQNRVKFAPTAGDVHLRPCSIVAGPDPAYGLVTTDWSGDVQYDMSCNRTGDIQVMVNRVGSLGAYDAPGVPGTNVFVEASSVEGAFIAIADVRGTFMSGSFEEYETVLGNGFRSVTRKWSSPSEANGYFSGSFGGPFDAIY